MLMEADERMYNQAGDKAGAVPAIASDGAQDGQTGARTDPRAHKLALAVLDHTRSRLMACLPYMNLALLKMPVTLTEGNALVQETIRQGHGVCSTDGKEITWVTQDILTRFSRGEQYVSRAYLHMVLHCIFLHPFAYDRMNGTWWDAAADIAVEHTIRGLGFRELMCSEDIRQRETETRLLGHLDEITAEEIYRAMQADPELAKELVLSRGIFAQDEHHAWITSDSDERVIRQSLYARADKTDAPENSWRRVQANIHLLKQDDSNRRGDRAGSRVIEAGDIRPAYRDYARLLLQFAVPSEEARLNPEEFDYIYYTYGLKLYKRIPLVEPLEYREARKVHDLMIAIDTSGSTQGTRVRSFLSQTCAILGRGDCFFDRFRLHLVQCDCEIQHDDLITSREEFTRIIRRYRIKGAGGTSFEPVFTYARELMDAGEGTDLQGIIYFTDGYGKFPSEDPGIPTVFVLYDTDISDDELPVWARTVRID